MATTSPDRNGLRSEPGNHAHSPATRGQRPTSSSDARLAADERKGTSSSSRGVERRQQERLFPGAAHEEWTLGRKS